MLNFSKRLNSFVKECTVLAIHSSLITNRKEDNMENEEDHFFSN